MAQIAGSSSAGVSSNSALSTVASIRSACGPPHGFGRVQVREAKQVLGVCAGHNTHHALDAALLKQGREEPPRQAPGTPLRPVRSRGHVAHVGPDEGSGTRERPGGGVRQLRGEVILTEAVIPKRAHGTAQAALRSTLGHLPRHAGAVLIPRHLQAGARTGRGAYAATASEAMSDHVSQDRA